MTSALTIFDQGGLPAHLADLNTEGNIVTRDAINQLSFRGKTWRVILEGNEDIVKNSEGDPVQAVQVVILNYNKARSRSFFEGGYEEGKSSPPTCWSSDGIKPDAAVQVKQHPTCDGCPQSIKGSKVTDAGKPVTACTQFKNMVVVPIIDTKFKPLRVKIPQTSMWDGDNKEAEAKGFYAFDQYMDMLKRKGVAHTAAIITKIKFDPRTSYPKLLFGAHNWTPPSETANIHMQLGKTVVNGKLVDDPSPEAVARRAALDVLLNMKDVSVPVDEAPAPAEFEQSKPAPVAAAPAPTPAPVAPAAAPPAAPKAPAATRPRPVAVAPAPAPVAPAVDPDDNIVLPGTPAAAAAPAPAPAAATVAAPVAAAGDLGPDLAGLMKAWDD